MDSSLNNLTACKKLSLSTNSIDKMISLPGLKNLEILSLGRNQIKKIQGHEEDEVMTGVRDKLNDRFSGVENALDTLGLDIAAPLNLQQFVEHFAKLDVSKDEAEHIFDVVDDANGKTGTIPLEHVADTFANL